MAYDGRKLFGERFNLLLPRPLNHHSRERLRPRIAQEQAAAPFEPRAYFAGRARNLFDILEGALLAHTHVDENLRVTLEAFGQLFERAFLFAHSAKKVDGRDHAVASEARARKDYVARLFTAERRARPQEFFEHVLVAHVRAQKLDAARAQGKLKPDVAHNGCDDPLARKTPALLHKF